MKDVYVEGDFEGEIKINPVQFQRIEKKRVIKNNKSSGKITTSLDWLGEEVIILFPKRSKTKNKKEGA